MLTASSYWRPAIVDRAESPRPPAWTTAWGPGGERPGGGRRGAGGRGHRLARGLDPHLSVANARLQRPRVARARGPRQGDPRRVDRRPHRRP
ncbi:MAG: potassium-transporting ATPase subunit C [Acidimicrobiia bacterium]|nr:potassium-transporting ATPase subunit C [Acidimicrobiia bacterium]